ncbi:uncharacterized protein LOC143287955 [Babylonia areolata]|uniref:uncharacterized protein LOC143287955 n=1 Tax=Babylonia areolata TaxID=304850 RepID=UPI003FD48E51
MERVKNRTPKPTAHHHHHQHLPHSPKDDPQLCATRDPQHQQQWRKKCPHPLVHPDVAQAQTGEGKGTFRYSEDSRPMFSPIPGNLSSDGEDSPRRFHFKGTSTSKEKTSFPAIHVEKCDKGQPTYAAASSPEPSEPRSPDSDMDVNNEVTSQGGSSGGLNVPSPYMHRKADGRVVLVTQDSNRRQLGSWSSSEGNLPEALTRSASSPGGQGHLLDIKYRPDWQPRPTLRQSSDVALHELRRDGVKSPVSPRRLPARLEPLPPSLPQAQPARSASRLQSP